MQNLPTAGLWRAGAVRRCGCDWPFDWVADITAFDPETQSYQCVASIHQSGVRPLAEATANARALGEAAAMIRLIHVVGHVLDMGDPSHDEFVDSGADCLGVLLQHGDEVRRILAVVAGSVINPATMRPAHHSCHHD
jgi:hypothetical protein